MRLFNILKTNFDNFDNTIRTYLSKVLGTTGKQYSHSQIFGLIFDGIKGIMQNAMFYIEDALTEQNVETAYRKSSVYSLAKISGYEPYYGSAATGILEGKVKINNGLQSKANKVFIKNGTTLLNEKNGFNYIIYLPTDYISLDVYRPLYGVQFKVVQGLWKNNIYIANGEQLETIKITTSGLYDKEYIEVYVDGIKYESAACLYDMQKDGNEFVLSTGYDNELDIMFGNGVHGKQLIEGQTVDIKYIIHSGETGNISINDETKFVFKDSVYDNYGNEISDTNFIELNLVSSISGGSDADDIDFIKKMIGYNSRSLVLASDKNFKLFLKRFSFIGQSNIWCEKNSLEVNTVCLTNFNNTMLDYKEYFDADNNNQLLLTDYQKQMVIDTLNNSNKCYGGITLNFIDPIIYKYAVICYVKLTDMNYKSEINELISKYIAEYFRNIKQNTTFVPKSDIIKYILDNVPYIESLDITFISNNNENAKINGYYYIFNKVNINGTEKFIKQKKVYTNNNLGLDNFGNIQLHNNFEVPIIGNNVSYVNGKDKVNLDAIQIIYI